MEKGGPLDSKPSVPPRMIVPPPGDSLRTDGPESNVPFTPLRGLHCFVRPTLQFLLRPLPPSPPSNASFLATLDNGSSIVPDTMGAVGPNHLMVTINGQVLVQTKTGSVLSATSLNTFWSGFTSSYAFDPESFYDPYEKRWVLVSAANSKLPSSSVLVSASLTPDPTGSWNRLTYDADSTNTLWADRPRVGFNKHWVVVQTNMFALSDNTFKSIKIYVIPKLQLYAGLAPTASTFFQADIGSDLAPALTYDKSIDALYLLQVWSASSGMLRLYSITGPIGSETFSPVGYPTSATVWDFEPPAPNFAPQLGSAKKINTGASTIDGIVYRNGSIWAAHTVFLPADGTPTRSSILWWRISPDGSTQQNGLIDDPIGKVFYAYPSIAVNKDNDVLIGHSRYSATTYASAGYSFRYAEDPPNMMQSDTLLKAGEAPYFKPDPTGKNRWGDYSRCAVDPSNDLDLWTIQEYAAAPSGWDRWGLWWGKPAIDTISPATPPAPDLVASSDTGQSNTDNITADTTPTFTGTAEAYATVTLYANGSLAGTTTANSAGSYTVTSSTLAPGTYSVTVKAKDAAYNVSGASPALVILLNTSSP